MTPATVITRGGVAAPRGERRERERMDTLTEIRRCVAFSYLYRPPEVAGIDDPCALVVPEPARHDLDGTVGRRP